MKTTTAKMSLPRVRQNKNVNIQKFLQDLKDNEQEPALEDGLDTTSKSDDVDQFRTLDWSNDLSVIECESLVGFLYGKISLLVLCFGTL
jgi:hypothetical protein